MKVDLGVRTKLHNLRCWIIQQYNKDVLIYTFFSSVLVGVITHGMAIFNKISYHDDFMIVSSAGATSGRWAGDLYDYFSKYVFWDFISTPVLFGVLTILFLAMSAYLVCMLFELEKKIVLIVVSGLIVSFPTIISCYGYMFMVHTYGLAVFLSVLTVYITCKTKRYYISIPAAVFACFAVGIYQALLAVVLSLYLGYMLYDSFSRKEYNVRTMITDSVYYSINSIVVLAGYLIAEKILLMVKNEELSDYQGISSMGQDGLLTYFGRIRTAYSMFFDPLKGSADVYPLTVRYVYYLVLAFVITEMVIILWVRYKSVNKIRILCSICLFLLLPLAIDFIYIMVDSDKTFVYSVMLYSLVFPFIMLAILIDKQERIFTVSKLVIIRKVLLAVEVLSLVIVLVSNIRYANICYTKALVLQEQAKSYFTVLISNITSTEGYSSDLPVMFVDENDKKAVNEIKLTNFERITIPPYSMDSLINSYSWKAFMELWCGYKPKEPENTDDRKKEIQKMNRYPDDGSIKILDGIVVVKF